MASNLEGDLSLMVVNRRPSAQNWRMEVASQLSSFEPVDSGPWQTFVWHLRPRNHLDAYCRRLSKACCGVPWFRSRPWRWVVGCALQRISYKPFLLKVHLAEMRLGGAEHVFSRVVPICRRAADWRPAL